MKILEQIPTPPHFNTRVDKNRLLALLQEDCLNHTDIARRLGVSKERIRQLANQLINQTGRERQQVCGFNKCEALISAIPFVAEARSRGLEAGPYRMQKRLFVVNGYVCAIFLGRWRGYKKRYLSVHAPDCDADFAIYTVPGQSRFVIIPQAEWPTRRTAFSLEPLAKQPSYSGRHNWRSYVDAWHLLKGDDK